MIYQIYGNHLEAQKILTKNYDEIIELFNKSEIHLHKDILNVTNVINVYRRIHDAKQYEGRLAEYYDTLIDYFKHLRIG